MADFTVIIASIVISMLATLIITMCCRCFSDRIETFMISMPVSLSDSITELRDTARKIRAIHLPEGNTWLSKVETTLEKARSLILSEYCSSAQNNDARRSSSCFSCFKSSPLQLHREVKRLIKDGRRIIDRAGAQAAEHNPGVIPSMEQSTASLHQAPEHIHDIPDIERGSTVEESSELTGKQIRPFIQEGSTIDENLEKAIVPSSGAPYSGEGTGNIKPLDLKRTSGGGLPDIEEGIVSKASSIFLNSGISIAICQALKLVAVRKHKFNTEENNVAICS